MLTKAYAARQFNKHIDQQVQEGLDSIEEKKLEILPRALLSITAMAYGQMRNPDLLHIQGPCYTECSISLCLTQFQRMLIYI